MELLHIVWQQYPHINQKKCPVSIFEFSMKNDFQTQTLAPPKNHIKFFKNQMLPLKPPYNILHFINILLSPNICTFWDTDFFTFTPHFFHTSKFDLFDLRNLKIDKFLPHALSPTQNEPKEPKRSQINPHLDHETATDILLEDAAYRCFDLAGTDLAPLSPNRATHLKSPKKGCRNIAEQNTGSQGFTTSNWCLVVNL